MLRTIMVPLPKKANARECGDFRTISLIPHASKILLKVLQRRLEGKLQVGKSQFGFRKGIGTRDAIGCMRMMIERNLEFGNAVFVCFVDFEKAFDRVNWVKMLSILKKAGVDWRDRRLITDLYMRQEVCVKINEENTQWVKIGRGVRQGCLLSPMLFNAYAEAMMEEVEEECEDIGVLVGGEMKRDVRFADDQAMVANKHDSLQKIMNSLNTAASSYGMKINIKKTKVMRVSKEGGGVMDIRLDGEKIEQVGKYKYLGVWITEDGRCNEEIKCRIAQAKEAFTKRRELLTKGMKRETKKRIIKVMVWTVALYGAETWTIRKSERQKIEAFEMWVWRRMEKISWTEHVTNEEVLLRVGEERAMLNTIMNRKKNWIGHVLRREGLFKDIIEGKMEGKRTRGRKRMGMFSDLIGSGDYGQLKRRAENRRRWRNWKPLDLSMTEH